MNEQKLTSLLRQQSPDLAERTPFCPEDQQIAAWFDDEVADHEYEAIQRHLVDCGFCMARVGVQTRLRANGNGEAIHGDLLATAKQMSRKIQTRRPVPAPAWAAVAVVVLVVSLTTFWNTGQEPEFEVSPPAAQTGGSNNRSLRSIEQISTRPQLLSPLEGALVEPGELVIRWTGIPGSLFYDLYLMTDAGDPVVKQRVDGTEWTLEQSTRLIPGAEYFIRVEAHLAAARTVSSEHVLFKVGNGGGR